MGVYSPEASSAPRTITPRAKAFFSVATTQYDFVRPALQHANSEPLPPANGC